MLHLLDLKEVEEFVERTGVDSLAIAIGTSHGAFKFKPGQKPKLRFDILEEIEEDFLISLSYYMELHLYLRNLLRLYLRMVVNLMMLLVFLRKC